MALNHRAAAARRFEDRLVETIRCFDCGSRRGERCVVRNREVVTCCQARVDFGRPILEAIARFKLMLAECGLIEWPWS